MKKERKERVEIPEEGGRDEGAPIEFSITLYHPCWNSTKKYLQEKEQQGTLSFLNLHNKMCKNAVAYFFFF